MFLIDAIKLNVENKIKFSFFMRQFWGGKSGTYKIKLALFLFAFGLLAATKTLFKRKKKIILQYRFDWGSKLLLTHCTLTMEIE